MPTSRRSKKEGDKLSKEFTKDDVIQNKKEAIKSLNKMLEGFINDPTGAHLKKLTCYRIG